MIDLDFDPARQPGRASRFLLETLFALACYCLTVAGASFFIFAVEGVEWAWQAGTVCLLFSFAFFGLFQLARGQ